MNRFLLFDSGCALCSGLASAIERESDGWLSARSLRDKRIQGVLNRERPGWQWEPTLLEVDNEQVRVLTGLAMRVRLLGGLGLRRSWRVGQLVGRAVLPSDVSLERRHFLQRAGLVLGGFVLLGLPTRWWPGRDGPLQAERRMDPALRGEEYAGFLLLPEQAEVPSSVEDYKHGIPTACGVSDGEPNQASHPHDAVHLDLADAHALAVQGQFPTYTLASLPPELGLRPGPASLIKHDSGELFGGWTTFEAYDAKAKTWYTAASILAQVDHPHPVPLRSSKPVEPNGPGVVLEKVDLPVGAGVLVRTFVGFTLHWIYQDVWYTLSVEHLPGADPQTFASALALAA